uniref:C-type lectin n=1 Tax=Onchidium reevesii TaxID=2547651 RepID=A0A5P9Q461_9EUPU|nr:C-type lectin [Onchidium reevesii]
MEAVYTTVLSVFVIIHGACAMSCPDFVTEVPHSYTAVHNHVCYLFVNNEVFWPTARDKCFELGGEMLSIEDQATMDFIKDQLNSKELRWDRKGVWLGARYRNSNWEWTNGRRVSYTNWASGEPSKLFGFLSVEDCAQMRKEDNWQWHDFPCGSLKFHYNYVCEFPLNKPGDSAGRVAPSASGQEDNGNVYLK